MFNISRVPLRTFNFVAVFLLLCCCSGGGSNTTEDNLPDLPPEYRALMESLIEPDGFPGGVMGVMIGDNWYVGAAGVANVETGELMRPEMKVRLASMTKVFTAALIMKLVDNGMLTLQDSLEHWVPGAHAEGSRITVRMLLNHTSGIHDHETTAEYYGQLDANPAHEWSKEEVLNIIRSYPLDFEPGSQASYSNSGYYLLGIIAEEACGETVQEGLERYFFNPQGIHNTEVLAGRLSDPACHHYIKNPATEAFTDVTQWNLSWDWTAGSGVSTAGDMLHWLDALFVQPLLTPESLAQMTAPGTAAGIFGFGIELQQTGSYTLYSHGGANPGNFGRWSYFPQLHAGFFITFNELSDSQMETYRSRISEVFQQILSQLIRDSGGTY